MLVSTEQIKVVLPGVKISPYGLQFFGVFRKKSGITKKNWYFFLFEKERNKKGKN